MGGPVATSGLVGRAPDLLALRSASARAREGAPEVVIVAGEAGIGKTRLIETFAAEAVAAGDHVLRGGCLDLGDDGMPYAPISEALRTFLLETSILTRLTGDLCDAVTGTTGGGGILSPRTKTGRKKP